MDVLLKTPQVPYLSMIVLKLVAFSVTPNFLIFILILIQFDLFDHPKQVLPFLLNTTLNTNLEKLVCHSPRISFFFSGLRADACLFFGLLFGRSFVLMKKRIYTIIIMFGYSFNHIHNT